MYVKIVRHLENEQVVQVASSSSGSLEEKGVPSEHHMFECLEAVYRKVAVNDRAEFIKRMNKIETVRVIIDPPAERNIPFEFIQIKKIVKEDDEKFVDETLIARGCVLYLMNNEGKTIDSMVCR